MDNWVTAELASINLGDNRLNTRASAILQAFFRNTRSSIPEAFSCFADMKACYRFFSNHKIDRNKLLAPHIESTIQRIQEHPVVLLISDSSSLDFSGKSSIDGMGRIRSEYSRGLWLHPTIAVTPSQLCLGVIDAEIWTRAIPIKRESGKVIDKKEIKNKESYKWIKSYQSSCEIASLCPKSQIVNVIDREGDIMELLVEVSKKKHDPDFSDIIIRSSANRVSEAGTKLKEQLGSSKVLGTIEFTLPTGRNREPRKVIQSVRAVEFTPRKKWFNYGYLPEVKINAVTAVEEHPPEGSKAVEWTFLTTLPIESFEKAGKVIEYYLCRWQIETFFKVLKSGCKIEDNCLRRV